MNPGIIMQLSFPFFLVPPLPAGRGCWLMVLHHMISAASSFLVLSPAYRVSHIAHLSRIENRDVPTAHCPVAPPYCLRFSPALPHMICICNRSTSPALRDTLDTALFPLDIDISFVDLSCYLPRLKNLPLLVQLLNIPKTLVTILRTANSNQRTFWSSRSSSIATSYPPNSRHGYSSLSRAPQGRAACMT